MKRNQVLWVGQISGQTDEGKMATQFGPVKQRIIFNSPSHGCNKFKKETVIQTSCLWVA